MKIKHAGVCAAAALLTSLAAAPISHADPISDLIDIINSGSAGTTPEPGPATQPNNENMGIVANEVLVRVNAERAKVNCPPLTIDSRLQQAAQGHADDMAEHNRLSNDSSNGKSPSQRVDDVGYQWSKNGLNVAERQDDADEVMAAWMQGAGQRANILDCGFTNMGLGVRYGPFDRDFPNHQYPDSTPRTGPYWAQVFATPL